MAPTEAVIGNRAKSLKHPGLVLLATTGFALVVAVWTVVRAPTEQTTSPLFIHDVTQLNPIHVSMVITPTTPQEIIEAVKTHNGPISVGGARHSMGGQIATAGALYIDMHAFDKIARGVHTPRRQRHQRVHPTREPGSGVAPCVGAH